MLKEATNAVRQTETTPVAVAIFIAKYDWLMGWALQFTQNDRQVAEDLVQETFVRFALSQSTHMDAQDIRNTESVLYRYLKYAHLSILRDAARSRLQSLDAIDFDSLSFSLRAIRTADPIEVQHELRKVVTYVSWRKESAKTASILILRFIHGYFPEEIMKISLATRRAVDIAIAKAREETKRYIKDSASFSLMHVGNAPEVERCEFAVSGEALIAELKEIVFRSRCSACLPRQRLVERYASVLAQPIDRELLAHLVSCPTCLEIVAAKTNITPPADRSGEETTGYDRRFRVHTKSSSKTSRTARSMVQSGRARLNEIFEHHPHRIMIAVDGRVLATQDVTSSVNKLEIEINPSTTPEFLEILSDHGICLLAMALPGAPPEAPPEMCCEVRLSDGRFLEARYRQRSFGPLVEINYFVPQAAWSADAIFDLEERAVARCDNYGSPSEPAEAFPKVSWAASTWHKFTNWYAHKTLGLAVAACGTVAMLFIWQGLSRAQQEVSPIQFLQKAESQETTQFHSNRPSVALQKIRISVGTVTVPRSLHIDLQRKRRSRSQILSGSAQALKQQLALAEVSWDDPLSPSNFERWHREQDHAKDFVQPASGGLLTLTTQVDRGAVASESLVVRTSDFHQVGLNIIFRDSEKVEIAEVSYDVFPWTKEDQNWFEPLPGDVSKVASLASKPPVLHLPIERPLSEEQLDEAELGVRLALTSLKAYGTERITINRHSGYVEVKGIVATRERKSEIANTLNQIPHVKTSLFSFEDLQAQPEESKSSTQIIQQSTVAAPSVLAKYLAAKGLDNTQSSGISQRLLNSAQAANMLSHTIDELQTTFSYGRRQLNDKSNSYLEKLITIHNERLQRALDEEKETLLLADKDAIATRPMGKPDDKGSSLSSLSKQDVDLCIDLTAGKPEGDTDVSIAVARLLSIVSLLQEESQSLSVAKQVSRN